MIDTWVFDLDNTLYDPRVRLFDQIERRMTAFMVERLGIVAEDADRLRRAYWAEHGTTTAGLVRHHGVDPAPFLAFTHDIDFSGLAPDPALRAAIAALPGRRVVHTNGPLTYALRVLEGLNLADLFDGVFGIEAAGHAPKPEAESYDAVHAAAKVTPERAVMFEDDPRNLAVPHARGMGTVLVGARAIEGPHIDHHTADLAGFLTQVMQDGWSSRRHAPSSAP